MIDERSKQVLFAVISCYINAPGPVGSRVVAKKFSFGLSPATIRNIMADLEESGYLRQPHTSAGRVPTDTGYRFYVDAIRPDTRAVNRDFQARLVERIEALRRDINSFLDEASRMLSSMSHYIAITIPPSASTTTLHRIELMKFRGNQLAVILFTDEGIISNKVVSIDPELSQKHLTRIAHYLNSRFSGSTLEEIRKAVVVELSRAHDLCDALIAEAMKICSQALSPVSENVFISGLSEMLSLPDFSDIDRIRDLLRAIEDRHIVVKLLDRLSEATGTQVLIGSENPLDEMKKFSLVASTYREGDRPVGAIGIIGPTRMDYASAISLVDCTASFITEILSKR